MKRLLMVLIALMLAILPACASTEPAYVSLLNDPVYIGTRSLGSFASAPTSPNMGESYFNTVSNSTYIYNGTAWNIFSPAGATGPAGPQGPSGADGADGANGTNGTNGTNGADGAPGPNEVTTNTNSTLTGILTANGTKVNSITDNSTNWDTAYSWGNHSTAGYLTASDDIVLADGKNVQLFPGLSDHYYSGITANMTAGENLVISDICYLKSDGKWWKAEGNANTTMPGMALATTSISGDANGIFLLKGFIRDDSWSALTVGGMVFVSASSPGGLTQSAPTSTGNNVQIVGQAYASKVLYFNPNAITIELK